MQKRNDNRRSTWRGGSVRRGAAVLYVMISLTAVFGMAALAVDVGMLYSAQAEMQRTADATALAAATDLLSEDRLWDQDYLETLLGQARDTAVSTAERNAVLHAPSVVDTTQDVGFGYVADVSYGAGIDFASPQPPNAVAINVYRNETHAGSISLYFARLLGMSTQNLTAQATAAFADGIVGFDDVLIVLSNWG